MSGGIIKAVAQALGWDKGLYWVIPEAKACCPYDTTEAFSLIGFVAHAKAELAKRHAWMRAGKSGVYLCDYGPGPGEGLMTIRAHQICDYTCPISVAEAELRCIAEYLAATADRAAP